LWNYEALFNNHRWFVKYVFDPGRPMNIFGLCPYNIEKNELRTIIRPPGPGFRARIVGDQYASHDND
jgi:hypothetical protein